jgi:predicted GNAT superfamily acetyltransferase
MYIFERTHMTAASGVTTRPTSSANPDYTIGTLESFETRSQAARLYRSVFNYGSDDFQVSPHLLRSLIDNGGSALGAFEPSGRIVGLSYGFSALAGDRVYHYSQATVIAPDAQGRGLGRRLKLAQAEVARSTGASTMRWSYDPYLSRNAHFNLSSLGARGTWFHPDYYDQPDTDRMVVEWPLDFSRGVEARVAREAYASVADGIHGVLATVPAAQTAAGSTAGYRWVVFPCALAAAPGTPDPERVRAAIRASIEDAFADGLAALACDMVGGATPGLPERAAYIFGRH